MTESLEDTTLPIVFNQLQDVVITQKKLMDSLCFEVS